MSEITGQQAVSRLLADWSAARSALAEIERVEHQDITDKFGRVWVWKSKDLYRHCGTAAPADMIDGFALPTQAALDNPNYDLCTVCVDGRERNVPDCKPEWNCSHTMHAAPTAVPNMTIPEALARVLRHVKGAPGSRFGDTRERSAAIAGRVRRLTDDALANELSIVNALGEHGYDHMTREQRTALFDVGHAMRNERAARRDKAGA